MQNWTRDVDVLPPSRVTDLQAKLQDKMTLILKWTAPGDDLDNGIGGDIMCLGFFLIIKVF